MSRAEVYGSVHRCFPAKRLPPTCDMRSSSILIVDDEALQAREAYSASDSGFRASSSAPTGEKAGNRRDQLFAG